MKLLIVVSCALVHLTSVTAQYHNQNAYQHQPQHFLPIGPNGVPQDTPEVQHARAAHFQAVAKAASLSGPNHYSNVHDEDDGQYRPSQYETGDYSSSNHGQDEGHQGNGYNQPSSYSNYNSAPVSYSGQYQQSYNQPQGNVGYNNVGAYNAINHGPIDTPEVQQARAAHFAAVDAARSQNSYNSGHYRNRRSIHQYYGSYGYEPTVIGPHGVPLETPAVQVAKAQHFAAHQAEKYRNAYGGHGQGLYPVQGPIDTHEVQIAKAKHFIAYEQAKYRNTYGGHALDAPVETPAVQIARAQHLAAHAQEQHGNVGYGYGHNDLGSSLGYTHYAVGIAHGY